MADPHLPPGTIIAFAGKNSPAAEWLPCEGQPLKIADHQGLFAAIGSQVGGNGTTHFQLPDLRGRVVIGQGQGGPLTNHLLGEVGGAESHTLTISEMPAHSHVQTIDDPTGPRGGPNQSGVGGDGNNAGIPVQSTQPTGGGAPHNTMPPFLALTFLIHT